MLSFWQRVIDEGGRSVSIGGGLVMVVSDDPPPNKTHVVYVPLTGATAELLERTAADAERPKVKQ